MRNFLISLLAAAVSFAGALEVRAADPVVIADAQLDTDYYTVDFAAFSATLVAPQTGTLVVCCTSGDLPAHYADAAHTQPVDHAVSFYSGYQGYLVPVTAGETYYFYRGFCMNGGSRVWFTMLNTDITWSVSPEAGAALSVTGTGLITYTFSQPVTTTGGSITAADGHSAQLESKLSDLRQSYDIKTLIISWLDAGVQPGSDVTLTLTGVASTADPTVLAGDGGTITTHFQMPDMPTRLTASHLPAAFLSYWAAGDPDGQIRLSFTRPISTTAPGYVVFGYGDRNNPDNYTSIEIPARAEGNDFVCDLSGVRRAPNDLLAGGAYFSTCTVKPCDIRDADGEHVYSEGQGTVASWTFDLPYTSLYKPVVSEFTPASGAALQGGSSIEIYIDNYPYVAYTGVLLTYSDGTTARIDKSDLKIEAADTYGIITFDLPAGADFKASVVVTLEGYTPLDGFTYPLSATYTLPNKPTQGVSSAALDPASASPSSPEYSLDGRRATSRSGLTISRGKKVIK